MNKLILYAFLVFGFINGAYAYDIELAWTAPEVFEDGREIDAIDRFHIYHTLNNAVQEPIQVEANRTDYTLSDVAQGTHAFQITTIAGGNESERSDPVVLHVSDNKPMKIELTIRVVE